MHTLCPFCYWVVDFFFLIFISVGFLILGELILFLVVWLENNFLFLLFAFWICSFCRFSCAFKSIRIYLLKSVSCNCALLSNPLRCLPSKYLWPRVTFYVKDSYPDYFTWLTPRTVSTINTASGSRTVHSPMVMINFDGTSGQKANSTWQPHLIRTKGSTIAFSIKGPITTTSNSSPMRSKEVG